MMIMMFASARCCADDQPSLNAQVSLRGLMTTLPDSIYGMLAKMEWFRPARVTAQHFLTEMGRQTNGVDLTALLPQTENVWIRIWPAAVNGSRWSLQVTVTEEWADRILQAASRQGTALPTDPRWHSAVRITTDPEFVVIRRLPPHANVVIINRGMLTAAMDQPVSATESIQVDVDPAILFPSLTPLKLSTIRIATSLDSVGSNERIEWPVTAAWIRPPDRSLIQRLPPSTAWCAAMGIDGKQMNGQRIAEVLAWLGRIAHISTAVTAASIMEQLDQPLQRVATSSARVLDELQGTLVVAITNAAPLPGFIIAVPKSPAMDAAIKVLVQDLSLAHYQAPLVGGTVAFPHPQLGVVAVVNDGEHWMITSDLDAPTAWLSGTGGYLTPVRTASLDGIPKTAGLVALSETALILRQAAQRLSIGASDAGPSYALVNTFLQWSGKVKPGWWYLESSAAGVTSHSHGVCSTLPLIATAMSLQLRAASTPATTTPTKR